MTKILINNRHHLSTLFSLLRVKVEVILEAAASAWVVPPAVVILKVAVVVIAAAVPEDLGHSVGGAANIITTTQAPPLTELKSPALDVAARMVLTRLTPVLVSPTAHNIKTGAMLRLNAGECLIAGRI